nr:Chaperone DnaJ [Mimivirus sp.]
MKYHPDRNKSPDAEEKFKKISHAHGILSDPEKKQIYDRFGEDGINSGMADGGMDPMADFFTNLHRGRSSVKNKNIILVYKIILPKLKLRYQYQATHPVKNVIIQDFLIVKEDYVKDVMALV